MTRARSVGRLAAMLVVSAVVARCTLESFDFRPRDAAAAETTTPAIDAAPDSASRDAQQHDAPTGDANDAPDAREIDADRVDSSMPDAGPPECETDATRCVEGAEQRCIAGRWSVPIACARGCLGELCRVAPSCAPSLASCGLEGASCCDAPLVPSGSFLFGRSTSGGSDQCPSGRTCSDLTETPEIPTTVSSFRLDRFEVTVGRFRAFVDAVVAGSFQPEAGTGLHAHLPEGRILGESGWDEVWGSLPSVRTVWNRQLATCRDYSTWTVDPGEQENHPISCVTWFEAYAFCIWDDGFLPTEAELEHAAAGGSEERIYPWSMPPSSPAADCSRATYALCGGVYGPVGSRPSGAGRWGHYDLAGNAWEWALDWFAFQRPFAECVDCANLVDGGKGAGLRAIRGGDFSDEADLLRSVSRHYGMPTSRYFRYRHGFRCAHTP